MFLKVDQSWSPQEKVHHEFFLHVFNFQSWLNSMQLNDIVTTSIYSNLLLCCWNQYAAKRLCSTKTTSSMKHNFDVTNEWRIMIVSEQARRGCGGNSIMNLLIPRRCQGEYFDSIIILFFILFFYHNFNIHSLHDENCMKTVKCGWSLFMICPTMSEKHFKERLVSFPRLLLFLLSLSGPPFRRLQCLFSRRQRPLLLL